MSKILKRKQINLKLINLMIFTKEQIITFSFYLILILSIYYNYPTDDLISEYTNIFIVFIMKLFLIIRTIGLIKITIKTIKYYFSLWEIIISYL